MRLIRNKVLLLLPFVVAVVGCNNSNKGPFTITWKNDDGTVLEVDNGVPYGTVPTYDGSTPIKSKTQQYTYTFSGWSPSVVAAKKNQTYIATYASTLNKYDVIFNSDGGSYTPETQHIDYGYYATEPDPPTKYSYDFKGWYEEGFEEPFNFLKTPITNVVELTAKWKTAVYHVTFHSNCGKDSYDDVEHGGTTNPPAITNTGYDLEGWYLDPTFEGDKFVFTNPIIAKTDLYANWVLKDCAVKFNAGEGAVITGTSSETYTTPTFKYGKTWKELNNQTGTKTGYTFKHWSLENSETGVAISESYKPEGEVDVYAVYTINTYTVSFVSRGGNEIKDEKVTHGGYITDEPIPTYGEHNFLGWYISDTYQGNAFNFATTAITNNLVLYAKWDKYDITFEGNGGYFDDTKTATSKTISIACGETPTITNPKRDSTTTLDYTFDGWDKEIKVVYEPATYIAQWESSDRDYTFSFTGTDCSATYSSTYHYNDDIEFTILPKAGDYVLSKTITVKIDNTPVSTGYNYNCISGEFSMKCTGNISVEVTATQDTNCTTLSYTRSSDEYAEVKFAYDGTLDSVNWGDGTRDTNVSHTYKENGEYKIYIFGDVTGLVFNNGGDKLLAKGDEKITSINLSTKVDHFKSNSSYNGSFHYMKGLVSITLPDTITDDSTKGVFSSCSSLTSISMPNNSEFTTIAQASFYYCTKLKEVSVSNYITVFSDLSFSECKVLDTINFPSNLTTIGERAFYQCNALPMPTLPDSLTMIDDMAFAYCSSFTGSLTIPSNVTTVGAQAFAYCNNLTSINVPFKEGEKPTGWDNDWNEYYSGKINYLE